jgi:hypothetical protein|tara:strand:- start:1530 stop:1694 length:165 start_codon:yes stop_codon:yes gene_type:complete
MLAPQGVDLLVAETASLEALGGRSRSAMMGTPSLAMAALRTVDLSRLVGASAFS